MAALTSTSPGVPPDVSHDSFSTSSGISDVDAPLPTRDPSTFGAWKTYGMYEGTVPSSDIS